MTTTSGQLSEAVANPGSIRAPHCPASLETVTSGGAVTVGACVSLTVTVNEDDAPDVAVILTVVVPTGKNEPEAGLTLTIPQVPEVVGAGKVTTAPH